MNLVSSYDGDDLPMTHWLVLSQSKTSTDTDLSKKTIPPKKAKVGAWFLTPQRLD